MRKQTYLFLLSLVIITTANSQTVCGGIIGVNMSGAEYSWENFPNNTDLDYVKSKGVTLVRLPISWEKFQPDLNGPLDANQVSGIKTFLDAAGTRSMKIIVDVHNYARYDATWTKSVAWNLWSNGNIASPLTFPTSATYTFVIEAKGSVAGAVWPNMEFQIDGVVKGTVAVNSATFTTYSFPISVTAGTHTITIAFTNDATIGSEDRNLYISQIDITGPSFTTVLEAGNMPTKTTGAASDNLGAGNTSNSKIISTVDVPVTAYQDFWTKLATQLSGHTGLYGYDIMNEPYNMPNNTAWPTAAQAAVNSIRSVDMNTTIFVEGTQWSSAENWVANNNNLNITDPANKLVYEAHQYFDNGSGTYTQTYDQVGATPASGVTRVKPFLDWIKQKNVKGYIGEFGVPDNDARWLVLLDNFLDTIQSHGVMGTNWEYHFYNAGDPSWWHGHSILGLNPTDNGGNDEPQMTIITQHAADPCTTTNIESAKQNEFIVFPNPVTDVINIKGITGKTKIKLFDVLGNLIMQTEIENDVRLNTGHLAQGVYTLTIETNNNMLFKKLVISE